MQQIKVWNSTLFYYYKSLYGCTEIQHGRYSLLKDGLSTPCTQHIIQRYRNTTWWIQPAQRRALDTMYIAHNTEIQNYNMHMVDTACSETGSRHHVHCTQQRHTEIQRGGYSLLKDGLSTPCTLHTTQRYRNTTWWIQPAQRRALDTMYIAHNKEIQKYNVVDTACSKTGSRHHVHCTQHRDTEIQHGGYSLLKDGLSTPCTLHTTQRYRNTTWWIQPAQRRALDTMYIAHNTEIQIYNMVDTACSKTGSRHHVRTLHIIHAEIQKYNMTDTACSKTGSRHHVHCTQHKDTEIQYAYGGYSLLEDGLSTPCTLHTTQRYRNTTWWIQPAQRRALDTMYIHEHQKSQQNDSTSWQTSTEGGPSHP